jgi:mono/diheme cytochrome c family protein
MKILITSVFAAAGIAAVVTSAVAVAGSNDQGQAATARECSACHMVYPPGLLPQRSWQALMGDLANHFGGDASLDEATRADIEAFLVAQAADAGGRRPRFLASLKPDEVPLRISDLQWFKSEHGPRARAYAKAHQEIKTIANCAGCHRGAERGIFEDD